MQSHMIIYDGCDNDKEVCFYESNHTLRRSLINQMKDRYRIQGMRYLIYNNQTNNGNEIIYTCLAEF